MKGGEATLMSKFSEAAKSKLSEKFNLTTDAILGEPLIEINGSNRVRVENHKGIVKYTASLVKVNTSIATLSVEGSDLVLKSMIPEEIVISGNITKVEYLR
jgi:sporulation protein YqfC